MREPTGINAHALAPAKPGRNARGPVFLRAQQPIPGRSQQAQLDPRAFPRGYDGNGATFLNDEAALGQRAAALARGVAPIDEIIDRLDSENLPPQVKQAPFLTFIEASGIPFLLVPFNPRRRGVVISNYRVVSGSGATGVNGVCFSFGVPSQTAPGELAGIPLSPCFEETNGTVSVDAIYVFGNDSSQNYPIPVLAYEANLALGNSNP